MEAEPGPEGRGDLQKVPRPGSEAERTQASAGLTPQPASFRVSCCCRRRVGPRGSLRSVPLRPGGKPGCDGGIPERAASPQPRRSSPRTGSASGSAPSTSRPPVLLVQLRVHLQLHPQGLQEPVVLGEQLLPRLRLLLHPGEAPRPQGGDVNSDARGLALTPQPPECGRD